jgi:hypothetical protein
MTAPFLILAAALTLLALSVALWLGPVAGLVTLAGGAGLVVVCFLAAMVAAVWRE